MSHSSSSLLLVAHTHWGAVYGPCLFSQMNTGTATSKCWCCDAWTCSTSPSAWDTQPSLNSWLCWIAYTAQNIQRGSEAAHGAWLASDPKRPWVGHRCCACSTRCLSWKTSERGIRMQYMCNGQISFGQQGFMLDQRKTWTIKIENLHKRLGMSYIGRAQCQHIDWLQM